MTLRLWYVWNQIGLGRVQLTVNSSIVTDGDWYRMTISLRNPTSIPAFMIRLRILHAATSSNDNSNVPLVLPDVTPAYWDDNMLTLFPGESAIVSRHSCHPKACNSHCLMK
jgi:hypothetical protein